MLGFILFTFYIVGIVGGIMAYHLATVEKEALSILVCNFK